MRSERVQVRVRRVEDHLGLRHLTQVSVRRSEHPRLLDSRKRVDARLDLFGEELETRHEDDGFLAALEKERIGAVEATDVAREEPAVPGYVRA
jgi:ribosome-associated translation inhibitor RaiA